MNYPKNNAAPRLVFDVTDHDELQTKIDQLDAEFKVREIEVTFTGDRYFFGQVTTSRDAYEFIKSTILSGIEVQEHFIALYLNQANKIIGYYHHSTGTINSTPVDIEIIAAVALKTLSKAVIVSHNHPSGNLQPSAPDKSITKEIRAALKLFNITLLDHIIITLHDFYSFADHSANELRGIEKNENSLEQQLRSEILLQLKKVTLANSPNLFSMMQNKAGYARVETMVIRKVMHDQMIPSAVIPLLESELDMI